MEKFNLCYCGMCNNILTDYNPQTDADVFEGEDYDELIMFDDVNENNEIVESFWGCPNCETDGYLQDITKENYEYLKSLT